MGKQNATLVNEGPSVVFSLKLEQYAIPAHFVESMVETPEVSALPNSPKFIRGLINLRGKVIPVIDLRLRLGLPARIDEANELVQMLTQREEDHKNWLHELEASIRENRQFKLATDPHKCAFGKWFDNYQTEDNSMKLMLNKFNEPHHAIHNLAMKAFKLVEKGCHDDAYELIEATKENELSEMLRLFASLKSHILDSINEIAIVIEGEQKLFAVTVDSVDAVEFLDPEKITDLDTKMRTTGEELIRSTAQRKKDNSLVMMLEIDKLM